MISNALGSCIAVCTAVTLLTACEFSERTFYEHEPSKAFFRTNDIENPDLAEFIDDGIVFVIDVKGIRRREDYVVWLGLYSRSEGARVSFRRAEIRGNGWQQAALVNEEVAIEENSRGEGLYRGVLKLFEIRADVLEKVFDGGAEHLSLKVFYSSQQGYAFKEFRLIRRVETHPLFPT